MTWDDAQQYVAWLSQMAGKPYRLLTEAEYEYAARAGTQTAYPWGGELGKNNAVCDGCGSQWDRKRPAPVGSLAPNQFGLYDMVGNVFEWVEDVYHADYNGAPNDGSKWAEGGISGYRVVRSGAWISAPAATVVSSAHRNGNPTDNRFGNVLGFRVARTLDVAVLTEQQIDQIKQRQQLDWCTNEHDKFSSDLQIAGCTAWIEILANLAVC